MSFTTGGVFLRLTVEVGPRGGLTYGRCQVGTVEDRVLRGNRYPPRKELLGAKDAQFSSWKKLSEAVSVRLGPPRDVSFWLASAEARGEPFTLLELSELFGRGSALFVSGVGCCCGLANYGRSWALLHGGKAYPAEETLALASSLGACQELRSVTRSLAWRPLGKKALPRLSPPPPRGLLGRLEKALEAEGALLCMTGDEALAPPQPSPERELEEFLGGLLAGQAYSLEISRGKARTTLGLLSRDEEGRTQGCLRRPRFTGFPQSPFSVLSPVGAVRPLEELLADLRGPRREPLLVRSSTFLGACLPRQAPEDRGVRYVVAPEGAGWSILDRVTRRRLGGSYAEKKDAVASALLLNRSNW